MKIIAVFMAILLSFCPIVVSREKTAPPHRLITEAASAGRKQVKTTETIIAADVTVESEAGKENELISQSPEHEHTWTPVIETIHHDPVYRTIHHEAQTEKVWVEDTPAYDETYENTYLMRHRRKRCGWKTLRPTMKPMKTLTWLECMISAKAAGWTSLLPE